MWGPALPASVVVHRTEDPSRLEGDPPHSKVEPCHAVELAAKVNRGEQLGRNTLRRPFLRSLLIMLSSLSFQSSALHAQFRTGRSPD